MDNKLRANCNSCGQRLRYTDSQAGRLIKCPKCSTKILLPMGSDSQTPMIHEKSFSAGQQYQSDIRINSKLPGAQETAVASILSCGIVGCVVLVLGFCFIVGLVGMGAVANEPEENLENAVLMRHNATVVDLIPSLKRSIVVRLEEQVSHEELRKIAMQLKLSNPQKFERTFIEYYLPGMKEGFGCWATTHFNPDFEIRIRGDNGIWKSYK